MRQLDFIIWMLMFPLLETICMAIQWRFCERKEYSKDVKGVASLLVFLFYIIIGSLLWDGGER